MAKTITHTFSFEEFCTVLGALRVFQRVRAAGSYVPAAPGQPSEKIEDLDHFEDAPPLTDEQIDALCERINYGHSQEELTDSIADAIKLALDDQEHWLNYGDPRADYGDELPEVINRKAQTAEYWAEVCKRFGHGELARACDAFADNLKAFLNPQPGDEPPPV